jgi:hypothetical protein
LLFCSLAFFRSVPSFAEHYLHVKKVRLHQGGEEAMIEAARSGGAGTGRILLSEIRELEHIKGSEESASSSVLRIVTDKRVLGPLRTLVAAFSRQRHCVLMSGRRLRQVLQLQGPVADVRRRVADGLGNGR